MLPFVATACAFQSKVALGFKHESPVEITETLSTQHVADRVQGTTRRNGQVVGVDCSTTVVYNVEDVTGPAFLPQSIQVSLSSRPLPTGTPFRVECDGPLVMELPVSAGAFRATATTSAGRRIRLEAQGTLRSLPLALGKRLRAEPGMQFVRLGWPATAKAGDYHATVTFTMPDRRRFRERALVTASVLCGRSHYLLPIVPLGDKLQEVPEFEIRPASASAQIVLPRITGVSLLKTSRRALSCGS